MRSYEYTDDYPTCAETHSKLRVFSDDIPPEQVTELLDLQPTKTFVKGESFGKTTPQKRKANGWFYSTKGVLTSRDTRRHLDEILKALKPRKDAVEKLISLGCKIDILSYYVSYGHGGPTLEHEQMTELGELKISVWWDVYFEEVDET